MKLLLATENPGKKKEIASILAEVGVECVLPSELFSEHIDFPEETGATFAENAFIKANYLFQKTKLNTLADDSGISVTALNNFPGVHSARWISGDGEARYSGLLEKMNGLEDRRAFFTCVLCLISAESKTPQYFEGIFEGTIATEPKGTSGFDYDYIFIPNGENKTLAELGIEYKNKYSHRAIALQKLNQYITEHMLN